MRGKILTEGELKAMADDTRVHVFYEHPDPTERKVDGVAYVIQSVQHGAKQGCWLSIGSKNTIFAMDWMYAQDGRTDDSECRDIGMDGDQFEIYAYEPRPKKAAMQQEVKGA